MLRGWRSVGLHLAPRLAPRELLPSMPHDAAKTDQLPPSHLDGTDHSAAFSAAALCRVRRPSAFG
jgi:hypothetical protein